MAGQAKNLHGVLLDSRASTTRASENPILHSTRLTSVWASTQGWRRRAVRTGRGRILTGPSLAYFTTESQMLRAPADDPDAAERLLPSARALW